MSDSYLSNAGAVAIDSGDTDHERIETILRAREGLWVCGSAFIECTIWTYSQRISEMVTKLELPIDRDGCSNPQHTHRSRMGAYRWIVKDDGNQSAWTMP